MDNKFTIIIPTLAHRPKQLVRTIDSLLGQSCGQVVPLVVLNGDIYDRDFAETLQRRQDIRFVQIPTTGVARARYEGRKLVDTPYFGYLDDDDEYLPDALENRHRPFEINSDIDVVVGNGWRDEDGVQHPICRDIEAIASDPADALIDSNWLASCSALFKSETVGPEYFDCDYQYLEWTYLAIHLALTRNISFVAEPTFIINCTPNLLSNSVAYGAAYSKILKDVLAFDMPR